MRELKEISWTNAIHLPPISVNNKRKARKLTKRFKNELTPNSQRAMVLSTTRS